MTPPLGPLSFSPLLKRTLWGGRRLGERLGKPIGEGDDYAESWELVDRDTDQSIVRDGPLAGKTLAELIATRAPELLGRHAQLTRFPLLLKYLDCQRVLSVQVHPDDRYAMNMPQPDLGKTEAWYIVESAPDSVVYAGLKAGVDRDGLQEAIAAGRTHETLHSFHPTSGQCLFIPAGTVHALGNGLLVAEVQQSSDTTFRLFDWNRVDAQGNSRQLHIEQALHVTDYARGPIQPQFPIASDDGWETLVACDRFLLRRARFERPERPERQDWVTGGHDSPVVLMVVSGQVVLRPAAQQATFHSVGETVLLPASSGACVFQGASPGTTVLEVTIP